MRGKSILVWSLIFVIGLSLRLLLASFTSGNYDAASYEIVAGIMERGGNVFAETHRYNYSPFWSYLLLVMNQVASALTVPLIVVVRYFLTVVDLGNAILIGGVTSSRKAAAIYALSPVAILIIGYHGQFDTLAVTPLLIILFLHRRKQLSLLYLWVLSALAILIKQNTVFAVWMLFILLTTPKRAVLMMAAAGSLFLLSFAPFATTGAHGIITNVFLYDGLNGDYGLSALFPGPLVGVVFWLSMLLLPFVAKAWMEMPIDQALLLSFLAFLSLTHGIGVQYFIFPAIFGCLLISRWHALFSGVAGLVLVLKYMLGITPWNFVWLVVTGWFFSHFYRRRYSFSIHSTRVASMVPFLKRRFSPP